MFMAKMQNEGILLKDEDDAKIVNVNLIGILYWQ